VHVIGREDYGKWSPGTDGDRDTSVGTGKFLFSNVYTLRKFIFISDCRDLVSFYCTVMFSGGEPEFLFF